MMIFAWLAVALSLIQLITSKNPMKSAMAVLTISITIFLTMSSVSGTSWVPLIMALLFLGGVLMILMILASMMPNETKGSSMLKASTALFFTLTCLYLTLPMEIAANSSNMIKLVMQSKISLALMTIIMIVYFLSFIMILSSNKSAMRSFS